MKTTPFPAKFQCHLVAAIGINSELLGAPLSRLFGVIPAAAALQRLPRRRAKLIEHRIWAPFRLVSPHLPFGLGIFSSQPFGLRAYPRAAAQAGRPLLPASSGGRHTHLPVGHWGPGELIEPPQLLLSSSWSSLCYTKWLIFGWLLALHWPHQSHFSFPELPIVY